MNGQTENDQALVERTLAGDHKAFGILFERYRSMLHRHLAPRIYCLADVDDLLQETFLAAFLNLDRFDASRDFGAWLRGICRNITRNFFREVKRRHAVFVEDKEDHIHEMPEPEPEKENILLEPLENCVEGLDAGKRKLVSLYYYDGLSLVDISRKLERSSTTLAVSLYRIRRDLKEHVIRFAA